MQSRSVLLLATNKKVYVEFALNCAASVNLHNPGLPVYIATNVKPAKDVPGVTFLPVSEELAQLYLGTKVYLDQFIQTDETIFLDSDCICYGNLDPIFDACKGMDVTTIGRLISRRQQWGDTSAESGLKNFGTEKYIIFNGGFYYIKRSALAKSIFDQARDFFDRFDELGFDRIQNGWKNEEGLFAISMVKYNQAPIADDAGFMTDLFTDRRPEVLNVLTGKRRLRNPAYHLAEPRSWYPASFSPLVLHFGGSNIKSYPYISQSRLLALHKAGYPTPLASFIVFMFIDVPYKSYHWFRRLIKLK